MTFQVGDLKTFYIQGSPPAGANPIYVYKFWDGSVIATGTQSGSVLKRLNIGGNPAVGSAPYVVPFRCDICDRLGATVQVVTSTLAVNNPPTIYGAPLVTPNNQPFPFTTKVTVGAYDQENNGVGFYWYLGTNAIGGQDVTSSPTTVPGTYFGTLTGHSSTLFSNTLTAVVPSEGTVLTCKLVDGDSGTTLLNVPLLGFDPNAPQFSVAVVPQGVTNDASTLASAVIAPGQTVLFSTFATDPVPGNLIFSWSLYGTNGWNSSDIPVVSTGITTPQSGGFRNDFLRDISQETGTGERIAVVTATNPTTGQSNVSTVSVELIQNLPPTITGVGVYNPINGLATTSIAKAPAPTRTLVQFTGTVSDQNSDVTFLRWDFTAPAPPTSFTLYGQSALVDITSWPSGPQSTLGSVVAIDRFGAQSTPVSIPQITVV